MSEGLEALKTAIIKAHKQKGRTEFLEIVAQRAEHIFNCIVDGQEDDELFIAHQRLGEALDAVRAGKDTPAPLEEFFQRSQSLIDFNGLFLAEEQTEERQGEADKTWNDFVDSFNAATRSLL